MRKVYLKDNKYAKALASAIRAEGHTVMVTLDTERAITDEDTPWHQAIKRAGVEHWVELRLSSFEQGKWYKLLEEGSCIARVIKSEGKYAKGYGLNREGEWVEGIHFTFLDAWVEATEQEVEHSLRKYVTFNYSEEDIEKLDPEKATDPWLFGFDHEKQRLYTREKGRGGKPIYSSGKWAKITPDHIIVKGCKVEVFENSIKVGCTGIPDKLSIEGVYGLVMRLFQEDFEPHHVQEIFEFYQDSRKK